MFGGYLDFSVLIQSPVCCLISIRELIITKGLNIGIGYGLHVSGWCNGSLHCPTPCLRSTWVIDIMVECPSKKMCSCQSVYRGPVKQSVFYVSIGFKGNLTWSGIRCSRRDFVYFVMKLAWICWGLNNQPW